MSQLVKGNSKGRDPPPTLFLHPSPAASHASLPGIMAPGLPSAAQGQQQQLPVTSPLGRTGSILAGSRDSNSLASPVESRRAGQPSALRPPPNPAAAPALNINLPLQLQHRESTRATDRTDALWAEMQATLEEVELSASGGTRVFGPDHDRKLADLRVAQIALAQAWARSEADDAIETLGAAEVRNLKLSAAGVDSEAAAKTDGGAATMDAGKSTAGTGSGRPGSSGIGVGGSERLGAKLEEETEVDILLARKRREANDRYFQRVNQGVLDVVAKLEEVAVAMRAVEQESKDVWADGDNESVAGSAKT